MVTPRSEREWNNKSWSTNKIFVKYKDLDGVFTTQEKVWIILGGGLHAVDHKKASFVISKPLHLDYLRQAAL